MKTYSVLYAADVPHYATFEVEAADTEAAIVAAKAHISSRDVNLCDPDRNNPILQRIVHIEDDTGNTVATDIELDRYSLRTGGDSDRLPRNAETKPLVHAGNCHAALMAALKAAEVAIEEASDIMLYEDGQPVTFLESNEIERAFSALVSVMVQVHEAIKAGDPA